MPVQYYLYIKYLTGGYELLNPTNITKNNHKIKKGLRFALKTSTLLRLVGNSRVELLTHPCQGYVITVSPIAYNIIIDY